jgi:DNA invertase Pin-like site-specific DNA recombinase
LKGEIKMAYFSYHRVSSKKQKLERGIEEINKFCKINNIKLERPIFTDKKSGKTFNRERYIVLKEDVLRPGDTLIITEIDRLGRNKREIVKELDFFKSNNIRVMILELPTTLIDINTESSSTNKLIIDTIMKMIIELYACLAEAELEKKNKRQLEGIEIMKKSDKWHKYGRPAAIDFKDFIKVYEKVLSKELRPVDAMKEMGLTKPTYYRYRKKYEEKFKNNSKMNQYKNM